MKKSILSVVETLGKGLSNVQFRGRISSTRSYHSEASSQVKNGSTRDIVRSSVRSRSYRESNEKASNRSSLSERGVRFSNVTEVVYRKRKSGQVVNEGIEWLDINEDKQPPKVVRNSRRMKRLRKASVKRRREDREDRKKESNNN